MRKLLVASQKGGVGKTTTAINLATAAAQAGAAVLLVDTDPLASVAAALNLASNADSKDLRQKGLDCDGTIWENVVPGLDIAMPAGDGVAFAQDVDEFLVRIGNHPSSRRYHWMIIDSPPILAGDQLRRLLEFSDDLLLIIRAEPLAYRTLPLFLQLIKTVQAQGGSIQMRGILLTMPPGETVGKGFDLDLRHIFGRYIVPQTIPYDQEVGRALLMGQSVLALNPGSPAAVQYHTLAQWLGLADIPEAEQVDIFTGPAEQPESAAEVPPLESKSEPDENAGSVDIFGSASTAGEDAGAALLDEADLGMTIPTPVPLVPAPADPVPSATPSNPADDWPQASNVDSQRAAAHFQLIDTPGGFGSQPPIDKALAKPCADLRTYRRHHVRGVFAQRRGPGDG